MGERLNPFPDKKEPDTSFKKAVSEIKRQQEHAKATEVAQEEATWLVYGEYPDLPVAVSFLTDIHFGSKGVDYDLLQTHIDTIAQTPNMFVLVGGDIIDAFNSAKHPTGISGDALPVDEQLEAMADILLTLDRAGKLGGFQAGNHDHWSDVAGYRFERFLSELNCPVFSGAGNINTIVNGGQMYRIFWSHTHWGGSRLNVTNASKRALQFSSPHADIALLGHTHQASAESFDIAGEKKVAVVGGTYKLHDGYGAKWGMGAPGTPGYTLLLWPDDKRVEVMRDPVITRQVIRGLIDDYYLGENEIDPYTQMIEEARERRRDK